jgi:threonyl-tRNA synthetase
VGTPFSEVYDQFLMLVKDYRLIDLYNASELDFETYLSGWLIPAIEDFYNCDQSLVYADSEFAVTLTQRNIKLLAKMMAKYWLTKETNDILQMNLHITDKDFKIYSEAANMGEKRKKLAELREEISQDLVDYSLNSSERWTEWLGGTFYIP